MGWVGHAGVLQPDGPKLKVCLRYSLLNLAFGCCHYVCSHYCVYCYFCCCERGSCWIDQYRGNHHESLHLVGMQVMSDWEESCWGRRGLDGLCVVFSWGNASGASPGQCNGEG